MTITGKFGQHKVHLQFKKSAPNFGVQNFASEIVLHSSDLSNQQKKLAASVDLPKHCCCFFLWGLGGGVKFAKKFPTKKKQTKLLPPKFLGIERSNVAPSLRAGLVSRYRILNMFFRAFWRSQDVKTDWNVKRNNTPSHWMGFRVFLCVQYHLCNCYTET